MAKFTKVALIGNPNSGKTTLFNALAGQNKKTGNWAGVTVSQTQAKLKRNNTEFSLIDLPGLYGLSLTELSADELVVKQALGQGDGMYPEEAYYPKQAGLLKESVSAAMASRALSKRYARNLDIRPNMSLREILAEGTKTRMKHPRTTALAAKKKHRYLTDAEKKDLRRNGTGTTDPAFSREPAKPVAPKPKPKPQPHPNEAQWKAKFQASQDVKDARAAQQRRVERGGGPPPWETGTKAREAANATSKAGPKAPPTVSNTSNRTGKKQQSTAAPKVNKTEPVKPVAPKQQPKQQNYRPTGSPLEGRGSMVPSIVGGVWGAGVLGAGAYGIHRAFKGDKKKDIEKKAGLLKEAISAGMAQRALANKAARLKAQGLSGAKLEQAAGNVAAKHTRTMRKATSAPMQPNQLPGATGTANSGALAKTTPQVTRTTPATPAQNNQLAKTTPQQAVPGRKIGLMPAAVGAGAVGALGYGIGSSGQNKAAALEKLAISPAMARRALVQKVLRKTKPGADVSRTLSDVLVKQNPRAAARAFPKGPHSMTGSAKRDPKTLAALLDQRSAQARYTHARADRGLLEKVRDRIRGN